MFLRCYISMSPFVIKFICFVVDIEISHTQLIECTTVVILPAAVVVFNDTMMIVAFVFDKINFYIQMNIVSSP